jgi:transcription initiation factor IIE alpha subunit
MKHDTSKRVASLIYFAPNVSKERVEAWIKKLMEQGHVENHDTHEYNENVGSPVWYIP